MKFSEHWLRTLVNPALTREALSHTLTMAGLEVEALEPVAPPFSGVVVAQILSADKHPDADRLKVCRVDVGESEPLQIVCGATNARAGLKAPCALVGARLPGLVIEPAKVRGVVSSGMMCSEKELGLTEDSSGLMELPFDAPVGQDIRAYLDLDDMLWTLKLTPNRSDCLSVAGIAREIAALTGSPATLPTTAPVPPTTDERLPVVVAASQACPRYCGRVVRGVNAMAPTPTWMKRRLERSGLRSISAIVDVTNYVLLELGQPLHAFDLNKLRGGLVVRMAHDGETLELLNQQTVELRSDDLVIADEAGAVALAGIMGGAGSAVDGATSDIFLESAFFSPAAIAGKSRRLGFVTDSSYRFERGVDFAATRRALERASQLILEICGGSPGPVTEVCGTLPARPPIPLRLERLQRVLGVPLGAMDVSALLRRLDMPFTQQDGVFSVTPPSWRFDMEIEEDLIEEVARLYGYERIPPLSPRAPIRMLPVPESRRSEWEVRRLLVARDYQEVVTYSFVAQTWEHDLVGNADPVRLRNPIASDRSVMRSSLFGGLVEALIYNLNRKQMRVRLFEIGACFGVGGESYVQQVKVGGVCYGNALDEQWGESARSVDFFDVKADLEVLLGRPARFEAAQHSALHPGQCARILLDGRAVGILGALHPRWQQRFDLPHGVILFELDLEALRATAVPVFQAIPKYPPIRRDLAVVVDEVVSVQAMLDAMRAVADPIVSEVALFDVYRGEGIGKDKKSLAFRVLMQDTEKTLTDREADSVMQKMIAVLHREFGAVLRS
ncbi:MAG: phenylalanine--tRNA ligase subunit beta [Methylophilaceae bacterium]|nr:phenylalanine--tRNA ligase subunit beta [Methylophilaceae bacterium]